MISYCRNRVVYWFLWDGIHLGTVQRVEKIKELCVFILLVIVFLVLFGREKKADILVALCQMLGTCSEDARNYSFINHLWVLKITEVLVLQLFAQHDSSKHHLGGFSICLLLQGEVRLETFLNFSELFWGLRDSGLLKQYFDCKLEFVH
jgi:hypothetical protein